MTPSEKWAEEKAIEIMEAKEAWDTDLFYSRGSKGFREFLERALLESEQREYERGYEEATKKWLIGKQQTGGTYKDGEAAGFRRGVESALTAVDEHHMSHKSTACYCIDTLHVIENLLPASEGKA